MNKKNPVAVIALGGNAILRKQDKGTIDEQIKNIMSCSDSIIDLIEKGFKVVLTHGNGPQVGRNILKSEIASHTVPSYPLDVCGAETQGLLGYIIQQTLKSKLEKRGINKEITLIITQVIVDK